MSKTKPLDNIGKSAEASGLQACRSWALATSFKSLQSSNPPKRGGIYPSPSPPMVMSWLAVCSSWRSTAPLFCSHVLDGKQYLRFGATLKIMKIFNFCSTYKLICIVSKTRFWHLSKTSSKNRPFYKVEILEIPMVFTLFLSSRGPKIQVPKLTFGHNKNTVFGKSPKWNC